MSHVEEANTAECADEEYYIKPTVVEVELEITEHLRYYRPIQIEIKNIFI